LLLLLLLLLSLLSLLPLLSLLLPLALLAPLAPPASRSSCSSRSSCLSLLSLLSLLLLLLPLSSLPLTPTPSLTLPGTKKNPIKDGNTPEDDREEYTSDNIRFKGHRDAIENILTSPDFSPIPEHACMVAMDLMSMDLKLIPELPFLMEIFKMLYKKEKQVKREAKKKQNQSGGKLK
jgi:hypothetical protein